MARTTLALVLWLLPALGLAQEAEQAFPLPLFTEGLHTRYSANAIPEGALTEALNVYLDEDVNGVVVIRKGRAKYNATAIPDTKSVRGIWPFDANDGTKYFVAFSSVSFYSSINSTWTVIPRSVDYSLTKDFSSVQSLGFRWFANGDVVWNWTGASTSAVAGSPPLGTLISTFRNRIVISGISGTRSTLRLSGELDGTDWTAPTTPVSTSPATLQIGGSNDGKDITCLMGQYQDVFLIGKKDSLWGLYGFDRRDFAIRQLSAEVGCIDNNTVQEKNNCKYWLSIRGVEKFCGTSLERISDPIRDQIDIIVATAGNARTNTDTSQVDFQAGNLTASGAGAPISATISPGNIVPSTWSIVDTSSTDFVAGTSFNVSTAIVGALFITQPDTATFINAGDESNSNTINWSTNDYTTTTGSLFLPYGTYAWLDSDGFACGNTIGISILDENNAALTPTTTITINDGTARATTTIDVSTYPAARIKINVAIANKLARSVAFIRPQTLSFITGDNNGTSACDAAWDVWEPATFITSGSYTSQIYNTALSSPTWGPISITVSSATPSALVELLQVSTATGGTFDTAVAITSGTKPAIAAKQYVRFISSFTITASTNPAAILYDASLSAATTGYFIGQCRNPGTTITAWGNFACNTVTAGGSFSFAISTGATCGAAIASTATWNTQVNNSAITVVTAAFTSYRILFTLDSATQTATVQDCAINWTDGATRPPLSSMVYRDRYYMAFSSSTISGASNDHILVLDKNDKWTQQDNMNCYSLSVYERKPYCGDSTATGSVWQLDTGTDDNGSAIHSRIKTKAFHLGMPDRLKSFRSLYLDLEPAPDSSYNIDLTGSYSLDRSTTTISLLSVDLNEDPGTILTAKFPFALSDKVDGRYIQIILDANQMNGPWRLYGGRLYFYPLSRE